ncbi:MAG: germination protein YpeB [Ruminococcus sp.]|nr:germination protein YpeB [Ruminococcus sp.]
MNFTRRGLIRVFSISAAAVFALSAKTAILSAQADRAQKRITSSYSRSIEELAFSCQNISSTLEKQLYTGSGDMQQNLAVELYKEAASAKSSLSQLPVASLDLGSTYRFLSQVGNYSLSLSEKLQKGEDLTDEEYDNISKLYEFSKGLCEDMWLLEGQVVSGELSLYQVEGLTDTGEPPYVTEGFTDFEGNFDDYPTLIYDGPFSDNILERTPKMTENADPIDQKTALQKASIDLNMNSADLSEVTRIEGKMPGWRFSDKSGSVCCEITEQGGYLAYFLRTRNVVGENIDHARAIKYAEDYLQYLGILSMERTYYEIQNNIMTINYAYKDIDRRVYPDLVKISVAMDNGDVLGIDARGYLANHCKREYPERVISVTRARQEVSPRLRINDSRLAVIPTDGANEVLCYEFTCKAETGRSVLVYINAQTAEEEDLLILEESASGTKTV